MDNIPTYKVLVLGSVHTGKTSLIRRYTSGNFEQEHLITTLPNCSSKIFETEKGQAQLAIWDTAGSDSWTSMNTTCYHGAQIVIYVGSYDEPDSLKDLTNNWAELLRQNVENTDYISLFAINKCDLNESQRSISDGDLEPTARKLDAEMFSVSAKLGTNVDELFERAFHLAEDKFGRFEEQLIDNNGNKCWC